jgi:glycosyltransferase involved in cell wall biosynthesis
MEIIHIVLGKANPDRLNGVNKVVFNMASEQCKAGKIVQVWGITPNPVHDYPERNFKTRLFKSRSFPFFMPQAISQALIEQKDAVFHLHGGWIPVFWRIARFMANHNIKYVITPHGAYNQIAMLRSGFQKNIYFQLFEKKVLRHAHKVHSIGKSEVDGLHKICSNANSFLLPYGFEPGSPATTVIKNQDFTIGFVGRLDTHTKGLDLLIKAFQIFQNHHINSKLWIIGEGEGHSYLENFSQENNLENVVLWGKKFGIEKDLLLSQMHLFAHPSRNEGLPTAVLEAAALGIPTIVSHATNLAEYVKKYNAGIAIENDNVDELVYSMHEIYTAYQNGAITRFVEGAKTMLHDTFSWPVLVEQYNELYK